MRGRSLCATAAQMCHAAPSITLCTPEYMETRACPGLDNAREMSCYHGGARDMVYINSQRWYHGSDAFFKGRKADGTPLDMDDYRTYVVNHEVGHWIGHGHDFTCDSRGRSPIMMQQTLGQHDRRNRRDVRAKLVGRLGAAVFGAACSSV